MFLRGSEWLWVPAFLLLFFQNIGSHLPYPILPLHFNDVLIVYSVWDFCGRSLWLDSFTSTTPLQIGHARKCWGQWRHCQQSTGHLSGWYTRNSLYLKCWDMCPILDSYMFNCSRGEGKGLRMQSPHTPKAPRHGPRPPSRLKYTEMRQVAAALFQEASLPSRCMVPSVLSKPLCKNRVLFYEDELCQAVAQNKLLWYNWIFGIML